jgi:hypothetical protein
MSIDSVVGLSITLDSSAPTKAGFGRMLLVGAIPAAALADFGPGLTKLYKQPDEMITDGFTANDMLYKMAVAAKSQSPSPKDFKVGKLTVAPTQIIRLIPTIASASAAETYSGKINGLAWTFTSDATPTLAEVCTGIAASITALAGVTATGVSGTHVDVTTDTAGLVLEYTEQTTNMYVDDQTADPATSISTQLASIYAADSDWYGIVLANNSEAIINAAAAWVETKRRLMAVVSADSDILNLPGVATTDVASDLKTADYFRTGLFYHHEVGSRLAVAIMAQRFTSVAGSDTWAHKSVKGPGTSPLQTAWQDAATGKNANIYVSIAGNGDILWGTVASGEYFDQVRGIDALHARIQEAIIALFQANEKLPFTSSGRQTLLDTIEGVMRRFARAPVNFLVDDDTLFVDAPAVADVDAGDKAARRYPDVTGHATLQGAVHMVDIAIKLSI